tara:strand:- start:641 stop:823 length:183 start_codon:yes stop_codon:yes gene_type:complete
MKDTNNKTDKKKEEHCYYSGLPSPMAYISEGEVEKKNKKTNVKPSSKTKKPNAGFKGQKP